MHSLRCIRSFDDIDLPNLRFRVHKHHILFNEELPCPVFWFTTVRRAVRTFRHMRFHRADPFPPSGRKSKAITGCSIRVRIASCRDIGTYVRVRSSKRKGKAARRVFLTLLSLRGKIRRVSDAPLANPRASPSPRPTAREPGYRNSQSVLPVR